MKISLIVAHWPLLPEHDELLNKCVKSIPAHEKIIVVNDGTGMGKALNKGMELATGDFFIISNNDCELIEGQIKDLCKKDCITIPYKMEGQWHEPRSFYCLPRWVYEKCGGYDEQFGVGYHEDDDLIRRWQEAGIQFRMVDSVKVHHKPGSTLDKLPNRDELFNENKKKYEDKWSTP